MKVSTPATQEFVCARARAAAGGRHIEMESRLGEKNYDSSHNIQQTIQQTIDALEHLREQGAGHLLAQHVANLEASLKELHMQLDIIQQQDGKNILRKNDHSSPDGSNQT